MKRLFSLLLAAGSLALFAGLALHYEPRVMLGIALGCIPTGLLGLALSFLIQYLAAHRPELNTTDSDERLAFINHRASAFTVQAMFAYLCLYTVLSPTAWLHGLSHTAVGSISLVFLSVVYLTAIAVFSRIY